MKSKTNTDIGGLAARSKKGPLWQFLDKKDGSFSAPFAEYISRLYFPLMNEAGMKSSVTPELKGDIASSFQHYLTPATGTEELSRNLSSRNVWVTVKGHQAWSATGNSALQKANRWSDKKEASEVEGHIGAFILRRENNEIGISSKITVFVPQTQDFVELMKVQIQNDSAETLHCAVYTATPIFGRHPDNFRDHRQVTTMFQKVYNEKYGTRVKPLIVHDEHGHNINDVNYIVYGFEADGSAPQSVWSSQQDFTGEGGSLDNPEAVFLNKKASDQNAINDGKEAIGAIKYQDIALAPGASVEYVVMHGISNDETTIEGWIKQYGSVQAFDTYLEENLAYWKAISENVAFDTAVDTFDNWARWIAFQLKCRQIFGNSYLPDFGYGRGGRGWRDLWQDLLSIFLVDPSGAQNEILNNFNGIRIDGSNATIIGTKAGEFIADRNNVARSWSDHGAWPVFVVNFYLQQTGDFDLLLQKLPYWKDQFTHRNKETDTLWNASQNFRQKTKKGDEYHGSLLEHMLIQQLSAFYNVGEHNNLLLEGADWNDTLDMAREKGESVCFHNFYSHNFKLIAEMLEALKEQGTVEIQLLSDLLILLDRLPDQQKVDYNEPAERRKRLKQYFDNIKHTVSGAQTSINIDLLINDLKEKSEHIREHIRTNEWIEIDATEGFFNGHYDNLAQPMHGLKKGNIQMDLTSQVMPIMCNVASEEQCSMMQKAVYSVLHDHEKGGLRLCTEFPEPNMNIGRITGFVYGHKEHGSKWMQQNIMFMYGLYQRKMPQLAYPLFKEIMHLSTDSQTNLIFPGLPSYFDPENRGAYAYLTGSAAWMLLSLTTQMFGVRGQKGNLMIHPQLHSEQFTTAGQATITCNFMNKRIKVSYLNPEKVSFGSYEIESVRINGESIPFTWEKKDAIIINKTDFLHSCTREINDIDVKLKKHQ